MSTVNVDTSGVNQLLARLENLGDEFEDRLFQLAQQASENMRGTAQGLVYGPHLRYQTGETGQNIDAYAERTEDGIAFGTSTRNLRTIYHELGTGPVGTAAGYPGEADLDEPVVRRSTPWSYWSDDIPADDGTHHSGFVTTEGTPPKAFMHQATMMELPEAERMVADLIKEFLSGK